jgi:hypothetical protein
MVLSVCYCRQIVVLFLENGIHISVHILDLFSIELNYEKMFVYEYFNTDCCLETEIYQQLEHAALVI